LERRPNIFPRFVARAGFDAGRSGDYLARMSIRPIVVLPDPVLRRPSETVGAVTPEIRALADDMLETMYDAPGIGLAAVQIGVLKRLVTVDLARKDEERRPLVLVDPQIVWCSPEISAYEEGCLSIPDYYEEVERPARVRVRFRDRDGAECEMEADGLLATCLQHELDHLDGVLFIDHLSKLKRDRVTKKFAKLAREKERDAESA
jgi:peptide deformylase